MAFMTSRSPSWALFALLGACAGTPQQVTTVARTDLGCDNVQVAEIAKNRYAASGCGRGGVYAELCGEGPCTWVRLRGAEAPQVATSGGVAIGAAPGSNAAPREVIQAPPAAQREVIAAPPPAQRQIIQAPPPAGQAAAPDASQTQPGAPGVDSSQAAPGQAVPSQAAPASAAPQTAPPQSLEPYTPQPTPLSQGQLSDPYEADVPVQPMAQRVEYPPPAPLIEQRPPPPQTHYVWVGGYWSWGTQQWLWAPGYWCAPRYGYSYVPGSWYWANNYWWYGPGGWARPGSTYIAYGIGPRPYRRHVTRSFTPSYRVTQSQPNRMGVTSYPTRMGGTSYPTRMGVGASTSGPARMGVSQAGGYRGAQYSRQPSSGFAPQASPLNRYPSSVSPSPRPSRMGVGPAGGGGGRSSGYSQSYQPSSAPRRFGSGPANMGASPSIGSSPGYRSAPAMRAPSGGGGGGPSRGGSMGRMGGGGSSRGPASMGSSGGGGRGGSMSRRR